MWFYWSPGPSSELVLKQAAVTRAKLLRDCVHGEAEWQNQSQNRFTNFASENDYSLLEGENTDI